MNKKILIGIVALVVIGAVAVLAIGNKETSDKTYQNPVMGISFTYPAEYVVTEKDGGDDRGIYSSATLTRADAQIPEGGEGPTSITFVSYQNNLAGLTPEAWARKATESNFNLNGATTSPMMIGGREAFTYTWDGLYRGVSGVIQHGDWLLVATVTTMDEDDDIAEDFQEILATLTLTEPLSLSDTTGKKVCAQVITPAKNTKTGEVKKFPTPCDVPAGWQIVF